MTVSSKPIFTAVIFHPNQRPDINDYDYDVPSMMTEPLLSNNTDETIIVLEDGDSSNKNNKTIPNNMTPAGSTSCSRTHFVGIGVMTGFLIQIISLGAYALLLLQYQKYYKEDDIHSTTATATEMSSTTMSYPQEKVVDHHHDDADPMNSFSFFFWHPHKIDWIVYSILSVLTQIDLVIYVLIWIAFTCTMTKLGMQFLRFRYHNPTLQRRHVFVLGVYFLVGIVVGAFVAWSVIDVYLGFPIPFLPIIGTVGVDLALCYLMVWCYDLGRSKNGVTEVEEEEDEEDDDDACVCC